MILLGGCITPAPFPCYEPCAVADLTRSTWHGEGSASWAGDRLATVGAVGGADTDLLVGAKGDETGSGAAYLLVDPIGGDPWSGAPSFLPSRRDHSLGDDAQLKVVWHDELAGSAALGSSLAALTGPDGAFEGFVLGAQNAQRPGMKPHGAVWVVAGDVLEDGVSEVDLAAADPFVDAEATLLIGPEGARAGGSVDAGFIDDGDIPDVLVGSVGGAWVLYGGGAFESPRHLNHAADFDDMAALVGDKADEPGCSVAIVPDLTGAGAPTLAVGACRAEGDFGKVFLVDSTGIRGATHTLGDGDAVVIGDPDRAHLGVTVADAGDVIGDGGDDLLLLSHGCGALVKCPEGRDYAASAWWVVPGGASFDGGVVTTIGALHVDLEHNHFSCNGADTGQIGLDAGADLVVGFCPDRDDDEGRVAIFLDPPTDGALTIGQADYVLVGADRELAGAEVLAVDQTVWIGAWHADGGAFQEGAVYSVDFARPPFPAW